MRSLFLAFFVVLVAAFALPAHEGHADGWHGEAKIIPAACLPKIQERFLAVQNAKQAVKVAEVAYAEILDQTAAALGVDYQWQLVKLEGDAYGFARVPEVPKNETASVAGPPAPEEGSK